MVEKDSKFVVGISVALFSCSKKVLDLNPILGLSVHTVNLNVEIT